MRLLFSLIIMCLLSACASQKIPDIKYYVLPIESNTLFNENIEVSVSSALQDNRILFKELHQVIPSHYHRWKAPLAHNLQRVLAAKLGSVTTKTYIHFDAFYTSQRGEMIISGYWRTEKKVNVVNINDTANMMAVNYPFEYSLYQKEQGYNALVDTAAILLDQLAEKIQQY